MKKLIVIIALVVPMALSAHNDVIDVRDHGATCNDGTDDAAGIQAAIDHAETFIFGGSGCREVMFPGCILNVASKIIWKSCPLVGVYQNSATKLVWDGPQGGTMIEKWNAGIGGLSFGRMEYMTLGAGANYPGIILDLSPAHAVDNDFTLRNVQFRKSTSHAINIDGFWNAHFERLRFDGIGGYAIYLKAQQGAFLQSFVLDKFTYDDAGVLAPAPGFMLIDNSVNSSWIGTVELKGARIEVNVGWGSPGALVVYDANESGVNRYAVNLDISNISLQGGSKYLVYNDSAQSSAVAGLLVRNVAISGGTFLSLIGGADDDTDTDTPGGGSVPFFLFSRDNAADVFAAGRSIARFQSRFDNDEVMEFSSGTGGGLFADAKFWITGNGQLKWGPGDGSSDIHILRQPGKLVLFAGDFRPQLNNAQNMGSINKNWILHGNLKARDNIVIGSATGGFPITFHGYKTKTQSLGTIQPDTCVETNDINASFADEGNTVVKVGLPIAAATSGAVFLGYSNAPNKLRVRACNYTGSPITLPSLKYEVEYWKH